MGERHSGDGPPGGRHVHPGGTVAVPEPVDISRGTSGLETRFGAALRAAGIDPEAERGAVAAFRAARDAGAHDARTRARDDWRPGRPARARRSPGTALSPRLASLTLGPLAVAALGSTGTGTDADGPTTPRSTGTDTGRPGDCGGTGIGGDTRRG
ncbi:hypothetical protein ACF1GT_10440 [Streptomyces sp. NPDC014636]|uniref:hypothetical protein n=1 Tax=Streptomyces sp. NPDC014636 TaxID=3364876 RepID=UPI0036F659A8